MSIRIGVIGGSGLYDMAELTGRRDVSVDTPFGPPSGPFIVGCLAGREVAFLARHGPGHRLTPSELNFRANIYAMKTLGVERILSASAVGSLKEEYAPLDLVDSRSVRRSHARPRQHVLRRRARRRTSPSRIRSAPTSVPPPTTPRSAAGASVHKGGTYVCMEGPQFSTRAESLLYRQWGMDIIGMTNLQEAKLAREAEICYTTIALVTDYDCWHPEHDSVTTEMIIANLVQNASMAQKVIAAAIAALDTGARTCSCASALAAALITRPEHVPEATKQKLAPIIGKYQ